MKIKSLTAAAVIALSSFGAMAITPVSTTTDLGTLVSGSTTLLPGMLMVQTGTSFEDFFKFTLPSTSATGLGLENINIFGVFDSALQSASLYSNTNGVIENGSGDDVLLNSFANIGGELKLNTPTLSANNYYIKVNGVSTGSMGSSYNGYITVTAVPEPETFAMLLAGLGLMGSIAMRRNKKSV